MSAPSLSRQETSEALTDAEKNRQEVDAIKRQLHDGEINYDQALEQIAPIIDRINTRGKQIADKMGMRHRKVTAREILR